MTRDHIRAKMNALVYMHSRLNYKVWIFLQARHAVICENLANKKRKVFDSSRQRAEGTDISMLKPLKPKVRQFISSVT